LFATANLVGVPSPVAHESSDGQASKPNRDDIAASSSFANDQGKDAERDNTANYPLKIRSSCLDRRNLAWSAQRSALTRGCSRVARPTGAAPCWAAT